MHRRHTRTLAALSALVAGASLAVGVPAAATAQTWNHADPAGDVTEYTYDNTTDAETEALDPTVTNGDVISTTIKHNPRKVIATMTFRDLGVAADELNLFQVSVRTNKLNRDLMVYTTKGHEHGVHELSRPNGRDVRCRGVFHRIDYTAHTVSVVIPRACLGRPRWVRVGAGAIRVPADFSELVMPSSRTSARIPVARLASAARNARVTASARAAGAATPTVFVAHADDALASTTVGKNLTFSPRLRRG